MMCGAGDSTLLLTEHVRDRGDLTVEAGRPPDDRSHRRGVRHPRPRRARAGAAGDVVVFALDELAYRPDRIVHDLPGGAPRLTRPAGGFRVTAVAGVVTQEDGVATGARPAGPLDAGA